ncbi:MAG TPA: hypothetical protein VGB18_03450, partial [Candidatus Thermoplasmatota archaeon]
LKLIWDRICGLNGGAIDLDLLYDKADVWDFVTAFNSVLFLHRDRRIELWQENFPYGPVQLKNLRVDGTEAAPGPTTVVDEDETDEADEESEEDAPEAKTP